MKVNRNTLIEWLTIMTKYGNSYFDDMSIEELRKIFIVSFPNYKRRSVLVVICTVCSEPLTMTQETEAKVILKGHFKCPICHQKTTLTDEYYHSLFKRYIKGG